MYCLEKNPHFSNLVQISSAFPRFHWQSASICSHYSHSDVIMGAMASQITNLTIVNFDVYSGTYQRKHQSSASLAFVRGIHRWPVNSPHKWPVTRKNVSILWHHHEVMAMNGTRINGDSVYKRISLPPGLNQTLLYYGRLSKSKI